MFFQGVLKPRGESLQIRRYGLGDLFEPGKVRQLLVQGGPPRSEAIQDGTDANFPPPLKSRPGKAPWDGYPSDPTVYPSRVPRLRGTGTPLTLNNEVLTRNYELFDKE